MCLYDIFDCSTFIVTLLLNQYPLFAMTRYNAEQPALFVLLKLSPFSVTVGLLYLIRDSHECYAVL